MIAWEEIGSTGVAASKLALGAAPLGNLFEEVPDFEAEAAIAAALHQGIRYFDTAPHYGLGLSERRLGGALANVERSSFTVSTKVGRLLQPNPYPTGTDMANQFAVSDDYYRVADYTRDGVRRSITESLSRLQLDYVDIALVHDPDDIVIRAARETIPALQELRDEGVVRAIGVGMNQWQALSFFVDETDIDVVMVAGRWTLLDRSALPLLDRCEARGVAVLAAAPFNSGILTRSRVPADATFDYRTADAAVVDRARRLAAVCAEYGVELPAAAVQFPLRHPAVSSSVCGMRSPEEVMSNALLFRTTVPEACWLELEALA